MTTQANKDTNSKEDDAEVGLGETIKLIEQA